MLREGMKCVIYVRVSTEMQVDGFSLDAQRNVLKRFAEREGLIVKKTYEDAGKSGKSIEGRPAFSQMLQDISDGLEIDYILVYKLSRFGRNAADILNSIEYIQSYDINLIATEEGIDSSQTSGKLLISVLSAVSEIERENILEQTMNGRKEKARQGKWNGGSAPYGYRLEDGKLIIDEEEAAVIKQIFDYYANKLKGTSEIASLLNVNGIDKKNRVNASLTMWSAGTILRILSNPIYKGDIAFGRRTKKKVRGTKNQYKTVNTSNYIVSDGIHEAIISKELWEKTQEIIQRNKTKRDSNPQNSKHLLSGILKCPTCGGGMYVKYTKKKTDGKLKFFEYGCHNTRFDRGHKCEDRRRVDGESVERYIVKLIKKMIANDEFTTLVTEQIISPIDTSNLEKQKAKLEDKLEDTFKNRDRLEDDIDNLSTKDPHYESMRERLNDRLNKMYSLIDEIESQIADLNLKIEGIKRKDITPDKILKCLKQFEKLFDKMELDEQRHLVELFIKAINFNEDGSIKDIDFKFPVDVSETPRKGKKVKNVVVNYEVDNPTIFYRELDMFTVDKGEGLPVYRLMRGNPYERNQATYTQIQSYIEDKYSMKVSTGYIAYVKRLHGIGMQVSRSKKRAKHHIPPIEKQNAIEDALKHYEMI